MLEYGDETYSGPQLSQQNKIQKNKLKLLPANYKHSRQKQKESTLSRIRHSKSKLLTAKTNRSRQQQIAHSKSQIGGQRFLVRGRPSRRCNTTRSTRPGCFPAFFGIVVIMFCTKCGCSLKEIDNAALVVGKVSSPIFIIIFWGYLLVYSEKYSVIFMSPTCFACVFFNLLLLGGLCCSCFTIR